MTGRNESNHLARSLGLLRAASIVLLASLLSTPARAQCGGWEMTGELRDFGDYWWGNIIGLGSPTLVAEDWLLAGAPGSSFPGVLYRLVDGSWEHVDYLPYHARGIVVDPADPDHPLLLLTEERLDHYYDYLDLSVWRWEEAGVLTPLGQLTDGLAEFAAMQGDLAAYTDGVDLHVWRRSPLGVYEYEATLPGFAGPYVAIRDDRILAMGVPAHDQYGEIVGPHEVELAVFAHVGGGSWVQEVSLIPVVPRSGWYSQDDDASVVLGQDELVVTGRRTQYEVPEVFHYTRSGSQWTLASELFGADAGSAVPFVHFARRVAYDREALFVVSNDWNDSYVHAFTLEGGGWTLSGVDRLGTQTYDVCLHDQRLYVSGSDSDPDRNSVRVFEPGAAHEIVEQPNDRAVDPGSDVALKAEVGGEIPLPGDGYTYRWRRNGVPLVNLFGISGAFTNKLTISSVDANDAALYDLVVTRTACGEQVTSQAARLGVIGGLPGETGELADATGFEDHFGYAIAVEGDFMLVGARQDDDAGTDSGAVYAYRRIGASWVLEEKLLRPGASTGGENFGNAVALRGDVAAIGAVGATESTPQSGAVYLYRRQGNAWVHEAAIDEPWGNSGDEFGFSVGLDDGQLIVGQPGIDWYGVPGAGAAYVYEHSVSGWSMRDWIDVPSDECQDGARFGVSVAISGDVAVVGMPQQDTAFGANGGEVRVFHRDRGWYHAQTLTPADSSAGARFGQSVAVTGEGNWIAVGASEDSSFRNKAGAAHVFAIQSTPDGPQWGESAKLEAPDARRNNRFGVSLALSGELLVVGAVFGDGAVVNSGSAYVFHGLSWTGLGEIQAGAGTQSARFGRAVSTDGSTVAVGAFLGDAGVTDAGSLSVFEF